MSDLFPSFESLPDQRFVDPIRCSVCVDDGSTPASEFLPDHSAPGTAEDQAVAAGWSIGEFGPRCPKCAGEDAGGGATSGADIIEFMATAKLLADVIALIDRKIQLAEEDDESYACSVLKTLREQVAAKT